MKQKDHLDSDDFMQKMKRTVALREDLWDLFRTGASSSGGGAFLCD